MKDANVCVTLSPKILIPRQPTASVDFEDNDITPSLTTEETEETEIANYHVIQIFVEQRRKYSGSPRSMAEAKARTLPVARRSRIFPYSYRGTSGMTAL
ncbi:hypothetical protein C900_00144 [Fulvivirga imtechensis AK7]|uniref:Uncharacterized protein n=2 Tax=Fulvivirga TaxID=396811 RepID=L8JZH3_9BACT|nr:hypothetical protein C900_00144 [Fulvivirga imtechensis AK7]